MKTIFILLGAVSISFILLFALCAFRLSSEEDDMMI